jgi:glycosyltransferase involved in cell wall biosynthesis
MSKKKKKRKSSPQRVKQRQQPLVRLSQVMIVKNEEKNIEKALSWAKDIAYEQIVVDTGSTDRTVELAEKMGAKVCYFEWINDFSAAKNFAMDQAGGNWIAILDADEYMPCEDANELLSILKRIQSNPEFSKEYDSVNCSWLQLDDMGKTYAVLTQQRIFQNRPDLRYKGKIHEAIIIRNKYYSAENLRIMHTGYTQTAFNEADKRERNIKMLRDEYKSDSENPHIMLYLADSIKSAGTEEARNEAQQLYLKALASDKPADPNIKRLAYDFLISRYAATDGKMKEALELCDKAISELPNHLDYYYFRGLLNNQCGNYSEARADLLKCEQTLLMPDTIPETRVLYPSPIPLYHQLSICAHGLDDGNEAGKYDSIIRAMLVEAKGQTTVAGPYIAMLFQERKTGVEVFEKLSPVYNVNNRQDLMLIADAAKESGAVSFAEAIMEMTGYN